MSVFSAANWTPAKPLCAMCATALQPARQQRQSVHHEPVSPAGEDQRLAALEPGERLPRALGRADAQELRRAAGHAAAAAGHRVEFALHRPRAHLGDHHPGAGQISPQRLAEPVDEMLAGRIRRGRRHHRQPRPRADVEHAPAAALDHRGHHRRGQLRHGEHVGVQHLPSAAPLRLVKQLLVTDASVVDQDVYRPGQLMHLGYGAFYPGRVRVPKRRWETLGKPIPADAIQNFEKAEEDALWMPSATLTANGYRSTVQDFDEAGQDVGSKMLLFACDRFNVRRARCWRLNRHSVRYA